MADDPSENKRYYFHRDQLVLLGVGFAITPLIIFVLGIMTGNYLEKRATPTPASLAVKIPVTPVPAEPRPEKDTGETAPSHQTFSQNGATGADPQAVSESKGKEKITTADVNKTRPIGKSAIAELQSPATKSDEEKPRAAARQQQRQTTQAGKKDLPERVWAVQINSSPDKKFADTWANRLKAKGYDAFVVEGEVKGQTWYRVRVGQFAARQEAEELRATLESKEGLSGGFLTMTNGIDAAARGQKSNVGSQTSESR